MASNDTYAKSNSSVASGNNLIIDGSGSGTGIVDIGEIGGTGDATIYREVDSANDGTWATSVIIRTTSSNFTTQLNNLRCSTSPPNGDPVRIRIKNQSTSSQAYYGIGVEL